MTEKENPEFKDNESSKEKEPRKVDPFLASIGKYKKIEKAKVSEQVQRSSANETGSEREKKDSGNSIKKQIKNEVNKLNAPNLSPEEKNLKEQNKQLKNLFIGIGIFVVLILIGVLFVNSVRQVKYDGVDFEVIREGDLIFYNTKIPLYDSNGEHYANHNFFLRNDPKDLEDVEFNGELELKNLILLNSEEDFNCDGDGIIAVANLKQLFEILGAKVIKDENSACDSEERYTYINLKSGDKTKIEQIGPACYDILINNCEILEGTERFMLETFIQFNNQLNN